MLVFRPLYLTLVIAGFALACSSEKLGSSQIETGGNTSWLKSCPANGECGQAGTCFAGVCAPRCTEDANCASQGAKAGCFANSTRISACGEVDAVCLPTCETTEDCSSLRDGVSCSDGYCVPSLCTATRGLASQSMSASAPPTSSAVPSTASDLDAGSSVSPIPVASSPVSPAATVSASQALPAGAAASLGVVEFTFSVQDESRYCTQVGVPFSVSIEDEWGHSFDSLASPDACAQRACSSCELNDPCIITDVYHPFRKTAGGKTSWSGLRTVQASCLQNGADTACLAGSYAPAGSYVAVFCAQVGETVDSAPDECKLTGTSQDCVRIPFDYPAQLTVSGELVPPAPLVPDAGSALPDVTYSIKLTNPLDCCDVYTLAKSDRRNNVCMFMEIRQQVPDDTTVTSFRGTTGADNCWERLGDAAAKVAISFDGKVDYANTGGQALMSADVVAMFATDAQWTLKDVEIRALDLPIDGLWYPAK